MPYSYVVHTGDGSTTSFAVPFPYISTAHVKVKVNGVDTSFTWVNSSTVSLASAPAPGAKVKVYRETKRDARSVDYQNGSTLKEADLDLDSLQAFYLAQEVVDGVTNSLQYSEVAGAYSAGGLQIKNIGDPTTDGDAVTLGYYNNVLSADVQQAVIDAEAAKTAAESAQLGAETAKDGSQAAQLASEMARDASVTAKNESVAARDTSISAKDTAVAARDAALLAEVGAQAAETGAVAARDTAQTYKNDAQTAQTAAETARDKAQKWAEETEDVEVETGKYSAKHHAAKAEASATLARQSETAAGASETNASGYASTALGAKDDAITAKTAAETARDKAQKWADELEDVEVETGKYSAFHWAQKAQAYSQVEWVDILNKPSSFNPSLHNHPISEVTGLQTALDGKAATTHNHSGVYEPVISIKNTAFNKNFGTNAGEVCQGNDSRLSDARTPTAHKSSHASGGADALSPADIGAATSTHNHDSTYLKDVVDDTTPQLGGDLDLNGKKFSKAAMYAVVTNATTTIDFGTGQYQKRTVAAAETLTFTAPSAPGHFTLELVQGATGYAVGFPSSGVVWLTDAGSAPDVSAASKTHIISIFYNGTSFVCAYLGAF